MSSRIWNGVWNPFSSKAKAQREEARRLRKVAEELHEHTIAMRDRHSAIYHAQKSVSDLLRAERRKNHFAEMFQEVPPRLP